MMYNAIKYRAHVICLWSHIAGTTDIMFMNGFQEAAVL